MWVKSCICLCIDQICPKWVQSYVLYMIMNCMLVLLPFMLNPLSLPLSFPVCVFRSEEGGQHLPHAEASPHCGAAGDIQLRWNALHGFRIVSFSLARIPHSMIEHTSPIKNLTETQPWFYIIRLI